MRSLVKFILILFFFFVLANTGFAYSDYGEKNHDISVSAPAMHKPAADPLIPVDPPEPPEDQVIKALIKDLASVNYEIAVSKLVKIGEPAVKPLIKALGDDNRYLRGNVVVVLAMLNDPRAVDPLINTLEKDIDLVVRLNAAAGLAMIGDPRAVQPLINALEKDVDSGVRANAAMGLGAIGDRSAAGPLRNALKDNDLEVRQAAQWALAQIENKNKGITSA